MADNAALLAEIDALNSALTTERAQVKELVMKYNTALSTDAALIDEYKAMNLTLTDTMTAKDKAAATRLRAEKAKGWGKALIGTAIGVIIGAVAAH